MKEGKGEGEGGEGREGEGCVMAFGGMDAPDFGERVPILISIILLLLCSEMNCRRRNIC